MLRHPGNRRTFSHNIRLAALLCLTAGFVNVTGFRAFMVLTTNVTGHVALFAEHLAEGDISSALIAGLWMLLFFLGALLCSLWIHRAAKWTTYSYALPIAVEVLILCVVGYLGSRTPDIQSHLTWFAGSLLFAMGLQNAMVSVISGAVVRTSHLTGMFTDLGIELSALSLTRNEARKPIKQKILLRLIIITSFFIGGVSGGFLFTYLSFYTFFIPAGILIIASGYDIFRVNLRRSVRKLRAPK